MNPSPKRPARLSGPSTTLPFQYAEVQIGRLFSRTGLGKIVKFSKLKCSTLVAHVGFMHQPPQHVKSFIIQRHSGYIPHLRHFQVAQISPKTRPKYQPAIGHRVQGTTQFSPIGREAWPGESRPLVPSLMLDVRVAAPERSTRGSRSDVVSRSGTQNES